MDAPLPSWEGTPYRYLSTRARVARVLSERVPHGVELEMRFGEPRGRREPGIQRVDGFVVTDSAGSASLDVQDPGEAAVRLLRYAAAKGLKQ
jgi:hypothetical protein